MLCKHTRTVWPQQHPSPSWKLDYAPFLLCVEPPALVGICYRRCQALLFPTPPPNNPVQKINILINHD